MNTKLLIVDDHPMLLNGLREALTHRSHLILLSEASTGAQAVKLAKELAPDVIVMAIHLPDMNGIEATRHILKVQPAIKILIFSSDQAPALVQEALKAGVSGFALKKGSVEELIQAIEVVIKGKLYLSAEVSARILGDYQRNLTEKSKPSKLVLSEREKKLLRLIAEGFRGKEIATVLNLSPNSIETYRARLMKKMGFRSIPELVRYAIREGIAPL